MNLVKLFTIIGVILIVSGGFIIAFGKSILPQTVNMFDYASHPVYFYQNQQIILLKYVICL